MSEHAGSLKTTAVVQHYTEVLMLPFRVAPRAETGDAFSPDTTSLMKMRNAFCQSLTDAGWAEIPDASIRAFGAFESVAKKRAAESDGAMGSNWDRMQHYQALNYFHPTVRNFLFGSMTNQVARQGPTNDYLNVFRLGTLARVAVEVDVWFAGIPCKQVCTFDVVRCDLALMQPDVGVLQLELRARIAENGSWPLNVVQQVRDRMRRLYPPYFDDGRGGEFKYPLQPRGGHFPDRVRLFGGLNDTDLIYDSETETGPATSLYVGATLADTLAQGSGGIPKDVETSPRAGHWRHLLAPVLTNRANLQLIFPGDDRLPSMAFIAVNSPRAISRGDWVRLTYANEAGGDVLPYSRDFLADFETKHCYDRFWHRRKDSTDSPSRIMNCGYAFTMVGSFADKGFFMNQRNGALVAFRQIYVRMGMVAHFQKTALLGATARLSALSWRNSDDGDLRAYEETERAEHIMNLYRHFIEFTHVFWFDEVSPQEQGVEMFAMWQRALRSKELYDEVRQELKDLVEYVGAERAKAQQKTAERFTRTAAVLGGLGVFAGLLGMNVLPFKDGVFELSKDYLGSNLVAIVLAMLLAGSVTWLIGTIAYNKRDADRRKR